MTHLVSAVACDDEVDDVNNVICPSLDLIPYRNILNLKETLPREMEINKAIPPEYDRIRCTKRSESTGICFD